MANTFDAALVGSTISTRMLTALGARMSGLSLFSTDFSDQVKKPKDTVVVGLVTAGSTTVVNPTDFSTIGGATVGKTSVVLDHIYQPFGLSNADIQNGFKLEQLVQANVDAFADKIWALVTANITTANFGAATVTAADSTFTPGSDNMKALWAGVSKSTRKGLVTNAGIYANLIPTNSMGLALVPGAYGYDNGVFYATSFNGTAKLAAFACSPEAIAVGAAKPDFENVADKFLVSDSVTIDKLGLTVYYNVWADPATRNLVASIEVMFGSAKGITSGTMALALNP
jgi:hypothetical protein